MKNSSDVGRGQKPRSAAAFFMLRGIVAGGVLGVLLYVGIDLGYLVLSYGRIDFGSGSMAGFLWIIILVDLGCRGLIFGLIIGALTAAIALPTRRLLRSATRPQRVLTVGAVSSVVSGALAWVPAHVASTLMTTAGEVTYAVGAAIVGGLVAAATCYLFESSSRPDWRPADYFDEFEPPLSR